MSLSALQRDCKTILENIRHLNNDELDAIMSDDAKLQELLHNLDQVHSYSLNSFSDNNDI